MTGQGREILVIGYGNPGRLDDGLGPALAEQLSAMRLDHVTVETDYQLTVEDAELAARHDVVVFADAAVAGPAPFDFRSVEPRRGAEFTTHSVSPEQVLGLAHDLFGATTAGYVLAIRGCEFDDFGERLSREGRDHLAAALAALKDVLLGNKPFPPPIAQRVTTPEGV